MCKGGKKKTGNHWILIEKKASTKSVVQEIVETLVIHSTLIRS